MSVRVPAGVCVCVRVHVHVPSCLVWPFAELTTTWVPKCPTQADWLHPLEESILETTGLPA